MDPVDQALLKSFANRGYPKQGKSLKVDNHGFLNRRAVKTHDIRFARTSEIVAIRTGDILPVFFLCESAQHREFTDYLIQELKLNMFDWVVLKQDFLNKYFQSF